MCFDIHIGTNTEIPSQLTIYSIVWLLGLFGGCRCRSLVVVCVVRSLCYVGCGVCGSVGWWLCFSACTLRRKVVCLVCLSALFGTEMKIEEEAEGTVA